jgi:hypothetical protein
VRMKLPVSRRKTTALLLCAIGGVLAMTAFMGLLLWAISPGPGFIPLATGALGCFSGALLGFFQIAAMAPSLPKGWIVASAAAGAIGAPISIAVAFPFFLIVGTLGVALGGFLLGLAFGAGQFVVLRKRYANTWPWIPISSAALGTGFIIAFPVTSALQLGFYPPFSPGWTAVGAIAGLTYGLITGLVALCARLSETTQSVYQVHAA